VLDTGERIGFLPALGGTVSGIGTIVGDVALGRSTSDSASDVAILSPGASGDGLGSLRKAARLAIELAPDGRSDSIVVLGSDVPGLGAGDVDLRGLPALDLIGLGYIEPGSSFVIAEYRGTLSGRFGSVTPNFVVDYSTPHRIVVTAVPEPGAASLALLFAAALSTGRRRNAGGLNTGKSFSLPIAVC
jgi:hypothetical protein